jgi:hypothetical protein
VNRSGRHLRLARQHRLIALQTVHLQQAQIGRNDIADPKVHHVAMNDLGNGDLSPPPVAIDNARCLIWECNPSTAFPERYSLKKLRPTLIANRAGRGLRTVLEDSTSLFARGLGAFDAACLATPPLNSKLLARSRLLGFGLLRGLLVGLPCRLV